MQCTHRSGAPASCRRARRQMSTRPWHRALAIAALLLIATLASPAFAATRGEPPPETLVFETRAAGAEPGSAQGIGEVFYPGHTFRVTERTRVTRAGATLKSFAEASVFVALHRVQMPGGTADVINDSTLVAAGLVTVPGGSVGVDADAALDVVLEPGWYAILFGTGRYGATAGNFNVTLPTVSTPQTPSSYGPHTHSAATGALQLSSIESRIFVYGYAVEPLPPPPFEFAMETVQPYAWISSQGTSISTTQMLATRFEVTRPVRVDRAGLWTLGGGGTIFAAIVRLNAPTSLPPPVGTQAFTDATVAWTLIDVVRSLDAHFGDLDGTELAPGAYALVFGSGQFGATGATAAVSVLDSVLRPGALLWNSGSWGPGFGPLNDFAFLLRGTIPEFTTASLEASDTLVRVGEPVAFTARITGEATAPPDGGVVIEADSGESCVATLADQDGPELVFGCGFGFDGVGPKTVVARFDGATAHLASSSSAQDVLVARFVDASVTIDNANAVAEPGLEVDYLVEARNVGPDAAPGVPLVVVAPDLVDVAWTCAALGGATCPAASGSGAIDAVVDLPADGGLDIVLSGRYPDGWSGPGLASAAVPLPGDPEAPHYVLDVDREDNTALEVDLAVAVFADGFEPPE